VLAGADAAMLFDTWAGLLYFNTVDFAANEQTTVVPPFYVSLCTEGSETVEIGSTVTVEKDKKTYKYTIVGSYEAKPEEGRISDESPLGKAFMHHKVGESVNVTAPAGVIAYRITKID